MTQQHSVCGEEIQLEEDLKTHLLLSHQENQMQCPLCSLSGVSYDELCLHILSAHPEEEHRKSQATDSAFSDVVTVSWQPEKNFTGYGGCSSANETSSSTLTLAILGPECTKEAVSCHEHRDGRKSEANSADEHQSHSLRKVTLFSCPICTLFCRSSSDLHQHVELHFQSQCSARASALFAGSTHTDLQLATQLQQQEEEEEQRRRREEAQQEKDFKKLQRQFGLDSRGGYRRQMEKSLERAVSSRLLSPAEFHCRRAEMMESLSTGVDDGRSRTQGVVQALREYYQTEARHGAAVWLSVDTDHYGCSAGDAGWGCGYRNLQMLLSALHRIHCYRPLLQEKAVPSVPRVQSMIEEAWKEGLDPQGASHFNHRLQGTSAWIGATEVYALMTFLRISARIIDFHQATGPGDTHPRLFDWVRQYFSQCSSGSIIQPGLIQTSLPPLYLQHQGHSRSIIGIEQRKNGTMCLLVLDPGSSVSETSKLLSSNMVSTAIHQVRKYPRSLKHKQYQVVAVQGLLSIQEQQISISNSRTLCAEKIP